MNRYGTDSGRYSGRSDVMDSFDSHQDLGASFQSAASLGTSNGSASSSKAVLAALRALQDKIRRLEAERTQALDETAQLRHQLQNQEIEFEHLKQRESLSTQKGMQESRQAYDRLLAEKADLELKVQRLEERNRECRQGVDELQSRIRALEEEKYKTQYRIKELETSNLQLEIQIDQSQRKEKELSQSIANETKRNDDDMNALNRKLQDLQEDLLQACREKGEADGRLVELDALVAQLLGLNETLVAKLSGKPLRKSLTSISDLVSKPKKKKAVSNKKSGLVPRAATVSTAATDAGRVDKWKFRQTVHIDPADIDHLQMLHSMYQGMAAGMTKRGTGGSSSRNSKKAVVNSTSAGKPLTRIAKKKKEKSMHAAATAVTAQQFENHSDNDNDNDLAETAFSSTSTPSGSRRIPVHVRLPAQSPALSFDRDTSLPMNEADFDLSKDYAGRKLQSPPSASTTKSRQRQSSASAVSDLQDVISSLEEEYDSLNSQYRNLLSSVHKDAASHDPSELISVLQKLRTKGEQLHALRSPTRS